MSDFTSRIDKLLTERRLKRSDLCRATDIKPTTYSNWVVRDSVPAMDKVLKIAKYFDVSPEWLIAGENQTETEDNKTTYRLNLSEQGIIEIYRKLDGRDKESLYNYARMLEMQDANRRKDNNN